MIRSSALPAVTLIASLALVACGDRSEGLPREAVAAELDRALLGDVSYVDDMSETDVREQRASARASRRPDPGAAPQTGATPPVISVAAPNVDLPPSAEGSASAPTRVPRPVSTPRATPSVRTPSLGPGRRFEARLDREIELVEAALGREVALRVTEDVRRFGATLLPRGARVVGTLRRSRLEDGDRYWLYLDRVEAGGESFPIAGRIVDFDGRSDGSNFTTTASRVGAGGATGAILGRLLGGDGRGAILGSVAGSALGAVLDASTADVPARLESGGVATIELLDALRLPRRAR